MVRGVFEDITGKRFKRLAIIKRVENDRNGNTQYLCKCDCGKNIVLLSGNIRRGVTTSCGCYGKNRHKKNYGQSNFNRILRMYKFNAKNTGKRWELSNDDFKELTQSNCFYCGESPSNIQEEKNSNGGYVYNGIDRVANNIGYLKDNCVACCAKCNYMKGNYSKEEFINQAKKVSLKWKF